MSQDSPALFAVLAVATLLGGLAVLYTIGRWAWKATRQAIGNAAEKRESTAVRAARRDLAEKTYFAYRSVGCPALSSHGVATQLAERYRCRALQIGSTTLPVTVVWQNTSDLVHPDEILGAFDPTPPTPFTHSATLSEQEYASARALIKREFEAPPSKVTYEGCDYRMVSIDVSGRLPVINGAFGLYYDNILTQYAIEWELKRALLKIGADVISLKRPGTLPLREAAESTGNPLFQGSTRCAAITISTLVVFERHGGEYYTIIRRRSKAVGVSAGLHHIVPAGMFEAPNAGDSWSVRDSVWRELLEEVYDEQDQIGVGRSEIKDYVRGTPPIDLLTTLIAKGQAELSVTGICCDLLNLRPEICTALWVPDSSFSVRRAMRLNWEYEAEGPDGTFGVRWIRVPQLAADLAASGSIVVSGAACLELGRMWIAQRHGK